MSGYNKGSGRSKHGYYKGIYCGSTYELCWVIYNLDHGIKFTRFPGALERDGKKYYPDFLLDDGKTIIETKGYEKQESVDIKTSIAENLGYTVRILRKNDLKFAFDYVEKAYNTKKFYVLYDDYSPRYCYVCSYCKTNFTKDKEAKTPDKFCSRSCAGKFRNLNKSLLVDISALQYRRRFTKEEALAIFQDTRSTQIIATEYNTTKNTIWFIKSKKTYKWIHQAL